MAPNMGMGVLSGVAWYINGYIVYNLLGSMAFVHILHIGGGGGQEEGSSAGIGTLSNANMDHGSVISRDSNVELNVLFVVLDFI